jgi:hypothetical protein
MSDPTPKPHYFDFKLKGYAVQEDSRRWGYFRSIRDHWDVFDKEGRKAPISLNYRISKGVEINYRTYDYRTLWGFEYQMDSGILNCGLEQVILTADSNCPGVQTNIVDKPNRKKYEIDFLSEVVGVIHQNSAIISECSPVKKERHYTKFQLRGFPEEFMEAFQQAIRDRQAYSLAHIKVFVEMEKLGLSNNRGKQRV